MGLSIFSEPYGERTRRTRSTGPASHSLPGSFAGGSDAVAYRCGDRLGLLETRRRRPAGSVGRGPQSRISNSGRTGIYVHRRGNLRYHQSPRGFCELQCEPGALLQRTGFDWGGQHFESPSLSSASPHKITWWGIFNEYNINGLTPAEYVELYNTVVPRMLAVDPTIQFSALELSDFDLEEGDRRTHLPTFVLPAHRGGVT